MTNILNDLKVGDDEGERVERLILQSKYQFLFQFSRYL